MGTLSEKISHAIAVDMHHRAMALIKAGPKVRAAEYLEERLRNFGIHAEAQGEVDLANGPAVRVHVVAAAEPRRVGEALAAIGCYYETMSVRGQLAQHFDAHVSGQSVSLLVTPVAELRVAA